MAVLAGGAHVFFGIWLPIVIIGLFVGLLFVLVVVAHVQGSMIAD